MFLMNKLAGVSASQLLTPAVKNICSGGET